MMHLEAIKGRNREPTSYPDPLDSTLYRFASMRAVQSAKSNPGPADREDFGTLPYAA